MGRIIYERTGVGLFVCLSVCLSMCVWTFVMHACGCVCVYVRVRDILTTWIFGFLQEYFFVPYSFTDVNDESEIHKGDEVSFYMAKNKR